MPFDPTIPQAGTEIDAVQMRGQLNGLKDLIDAIATINVAVVDGVNTLPPNNPATVSINVVANTLHFTFGIPQGHDGPQGPQGQPGEVSQTDLNNSVASVLGQSSNNSNVVPTLGQLADGTYNPNQLQDVINKLDELILALRR